MSKAKQISDEEIGELSKEWNEFEKVKPEKVDHRYFVVDDGPVMKAYEKQLDINEEVGKKLETRAALFGFHSISLMSNGQCIILLTEAKPSGKGIKQYKVGRSQYKQKVGNQILYGYTTDSSNLGKDFKKEINDCLGSNEIMNGEEAGLNAVGLYGSVPTLVHGNMAYRSTGTYLPQLKKFVISIPWLDVPKRMIKVYQKLREGAVLFDGSFAHLTWVPHKSLKEIRHSEFIALFEKNNYKAKAKAKKKAKKDKPV
jgi:hypothetical protein